MWFGLGDAEACGRVEVLHNLSHVEALIIHKLGVNQNFYTFASILLIKMVLCSKFYATKFINFKWFHMKSWWILISRATTA